MGKSKKKDTIKLKSLKVRPADFIDDAYMVVYDNGYMEKPDIVTVTEHLAEAANIVKEGNTVYHNLGISTDFNPFSYTPIKVTANPYLIADRVGIEIPVSAVLNPKMSDLPVVTVDEEYFESAAIHGKLAAQAVKNVYIKPRFTRNYDDTFITCHFMCKVKSLNTPIEEAAKKQLDAILKRFAKVGITSKKLANIPKSKLVSVPNSVFEGNVLHVFTTEKNRRIWLATNGLTLDD